ncbi:AAA family ATPase, partial [Sapientia aquatica]
ICFDDIHGMESVKARLHKAMTTIVHPAEGGFSKVKHRNGVLLFGEPGNGKTVFAEALAGELGIGFLPVTFGDVASKWVNDTTENVVNIFADARAQAPCVLFLDEIDSFISSRDGASAGQEEIHRTTNTMLTELVNIRGSGVVVVAATNYLDKLDAAAIREGRFDYKIEVTPPDLIARQGILLDGLTNHLPEIDYDLTSVFSVARRWEGFSVKRIQAVTEELAEMVEEAPFSSITSVELLAALRRVQGRKGTLPSNTKQLDDLILTTQLRFELTTIATRMSQIERVEELGGSVPAGLLFSGPPGTGKTEAARSLALRSGWAFLSTSGHDLISDPTRIDTLLADAKDIRPCIVFIDEADDVLAARKMSPVSSITNKLLTAMDGAAGKVPDIVFIAATNHPENMDPAALRGGRFTEKLVFTLPDQTRLETFVQHWMANSPATFDRLLNPTVVVALIGDDVSIADAAAILQAAVNHMIGRTVEEKKYIVTAADIVAARSTILGYQDSN